VVWFVSSCVVRVAAGTGRWGPALELHRATFGETRRRVKVIGRLPGERSCPSLVWAVLDRASRGWRGLTMTPRALRLLQDLRRQLLHPPADNEVIDQAVTAAA
jgi:putative transposase